MKRSLICLALAALTFTASPLVASSRDVDGSRMQARQLELNTTVRDHLAPPKDSVDWRYVRLREAADVTISISGMPAEATIDLTLTDAMGKPIHKASTSSGSLTSRRRLDPGLYYLALSSSRAVTYELTVR